MRKDARKAALAAYRERKVAGGIFAVRCLPSGQLWVGVAPDLGTIQNRLWFALRQGASMNKVMQAAWQDHGADAFTFEEVERLAEEADPYLRDKQRKERLEHWRVTMGAEAV
jgi:hypothetical protein